MAGMILTRNQLIAYINEVGKPRGIKASKNDSNKTLMKKANALGLGAKKAKPQYLAGGHRKPRTKKRRPKTAASNAAVLAAHRAGRLTQAQAMKKMGLDPSYIQDRMAFERMECRRNPGPDPYSKDMLILDPGGISYTGPFGPFGQYDYSRRSNPGLPSPGQVVGGMGDYMQMNPGMGDYLLEREIAPYESAGSINGLSDYMLLDMTPPAPKRKNPRDVIKKEKVILSGGRRATRWALYNNGQLIAHYRTKKQAQAASREWSSANFLGR